MNLTDWKNENGGSEALESLAKKCNTSAAYLRQLESGRRNPSSKLAKKIQMHTNREVTIKDLRPDFFDEIPTAA